MALRRSAPQLMTYDEYCLLPDDGKQYQVIEGELTVSPSPNFRHQETVWNLGQLMRVYAKEHDLGVVIGAPMDVILELHTIVQPDLLFIRHGNREIIEEVITGAPDLFVEVLSRSTGLHDRYTKKAVYARCGVPEYWIVDPIRQVVSLYGIEGDAYALRIEAAGDDIVTSGVLAGFTITARSVFA